jgi:hypothetical protein
MTARNIGIILGGLVDAVRYRDPSTSPATSHSRRRRGVGRRLRHELAVRHFAAAYPAVPTTAVLPNRGAPPPMAGDRNEIIGPERRRAT